MGEERIDFERDALEAFIEAYMQLDRQVQQPSGLYSVLQGPREQKYQDTLNYFLDPQQPHGFRDTLLDTFLDCIGVHEFNLTGQHIEIEDEVRIADDGSNGRIDLVICGGNALVDHPRWAVFLELKVGAEEGANQTPTYAETQQWNFDWFDSNSIDVGRLDDSAYVYLKREPADPADADRFESVNWSDVVTAFEREMQGALAEYPNRSVVQFTDFIRSLKETENMDSSTSRDELNERLNLYFEYSDLIQQIQRANSQFESDFENLSDHLRDRWADKMREKYDFGSSDWRVSRSSNPKWQGLLPVHWEQDPLDRRSTLKLYYRHAPTTDRLRDRTLTFRLRLPPHRNVHTEPLHDGQSFNDVFTDKCTSEYGAEISNALDKIGVDERRLNSASALAVKHYQLDARNLVDSYFDRLDTAVEEFCSDRTELPRVMNTVFEDTYTTVFGESPEGSFRGPLRQK